MSVSESNRPTRVVLATERITDQALSPAHETENRVSDAALTSPSLFVIPTRRGDGFQAYIRGHLLELADPGSGHRLSPTPDDLLIVSIASDLARSARRFLRGHGLADDVNVSAAWQTLENPPRLADISVTVAVSETAETMSDALMAALEERVAARSLGHSPRVQLRCQR